MTGVDVVLLVVVLVGLLICERMYARDRRRDHYRRLERRAHINLQRGMRR